MAVTDETSGSSPSDQITSAPSTMQRQNVEAVDNDKPNDHPVPADKQEDMPTSDHLRDDDSVSSKVQAGEPHDWATRLASMEAKCNLMESLLLKPHIQRVLADSDSEASDSEYDEDTFGASNVHMRNHKTYFSDMVWFMNMSRHQHILAERQRHRFKRANKAAKNAAFANQMNNHQMEAASQAAYMKGDSAYTVWVDWDDFVAPKGEWENSIMNPIYAVNGEPDPQLIFLLKPGSVANPANTRTTERVVDPDSTKEQMALPERIKIHSGPLHLLLKRKFKKRKFWPESSDGSAVFIRPFRELIFYEQVLRQSLTTLEIHCKDLVSAGSIRDASNNSKISIDETEAETAGDVDTNLDGSGKQGSPPGEAVNYPMGEDDHEDRMAPNPMTSLLHLRCLLTFIDEVIKPRVDSLRGQTNRKAFFHDLWHLLEPGIEVVDQKEKQAYRISHVEFPRHKVEPPWARWYKGQPPPPPTTLQPKPPPPPPPGLPGTRVPDIEAHEETTIRVFCAYIDFDGQKFGPVSVKFRIPAYGGLKELRSLPIYPLQFAKNPNLRQSLVERGRMLLEVSKFRSMYYMGPSLDSRDEVDSQVVIDFSEALSDRKRQDWVPKIESLRTSPDLVESPMWCPAPCCMNQGTIDDHYIDFNLTEDFVKTLIPDRPSRSPSMFLTPRLLEEAQQGSENEPTENELVVMTHRVFGFVLRSRKWAELDLTFLRHENSDVREFTRSAFDQLELPAGHRDMVKSLVTQHFRDGQSTYSRGAQTDLIRGKGKGLILLLHGAPGVGKTTTAEGVAELFQKPLFQITCGDLGTTARQVEFELEKNFALASRWGCILLLDEADVFLSARERKDFERNGLVAVFLRVLEYYTGILFLTTNRIGDFDEAFRSRIHMSLYYPELDEAKTKRVFTLNLDLIQQRFDRQGRKITYDASSIEKFAGDHFNANKYNRWNGRQIRNLCQTALALAEYDAHGQKVDGDINTSATVQLQLRYFELVQKAYLEFGRYMGALRGNEGDQRAYDNAWRAKTGTPYETKPSRFTRGPDEAPRDYRHERHYSEAQPASQNDSFQPLTNQSFQSGNLAPAYTQANMGYGNQQGFQQQPQTPYHQLQANPAFQHPQHIQQFPQMAFNQPGQNYGNPNMQMNYGSGGQLPVQPVVGQGFQGSNLQAPPQQYGQQGMQGNVQSDTTGGAGTSPQTNQTSMSTGTSVGPASNAPQSWVSGQF